MDFSSHKEEQDGIARNDDKTWEEEAEEAGKSSSDVASIIIQNKRDKYRTLERGDTGKRERTRHQGHHIGQKHR